MINVRESKISCAHLFIVATPIGNLSDISQRAIEALKQADLIAAEDTRHSKKLLDHFGIKTPMISLHEHNEKKQFAKVLELLNQGKSIALISDAGTPLVSDPGYRLVHEAKKVGIEVSPIPGPCAAIAALSVSGLPSDRFIFEGFLPAKHNARLERLEQLKSETRTMIFYESSHRVVGSINDMIAVFGKERNAVIARELTKIFETIVSNTLENLFSFIEKNKEQQCGEFVILVHGENKEKNCELVAEDLHTLDILLKELPVKQAAHLASQITGKRKNLLYSLAVEKSKEK